MNKNYSKLNEKYAKLKTKLDEKYKNLDNVIARQKDLKEVITKQQDEITHEVISQLETNRREMEVIMEQNRSLKQRYSELADRLNKIETNQLSNNAIISGIPEEPWESYSSTKQRVYDVIATTFPDKENALAEARSFDISYCT